MKIALKKTRVGTVEDKSKGLKLLRSTGNKLSAIVDEMEMLEKKTKKIWS